MRVPKSLIIFIFHNKEFLKITVDICDLIGLYVAMTKIAGKCEIKYLVAGIGWASAELIMTKLFFILKKFHNFL